MKLLLTHLFWYSILFCDKCSFSLGSCDLTAQSNMFRLFFFAQECLCEFNQIIWSWHGLERIQA